jgi:hypothetical protein
MTSAEWRGGCCFVSVRLIAYSFWGVLLGDVRPPKTAQAKNASGGAGHRIDREDSLHVRTERTAALSVQRATANRLNRVTADPAGTLDGPYPPRPDFSVNSLLDRFFGDCIYAGQSKASGSRAH